MHKMKRNFKFSNRNELQKPNSIGYTKHRPRKYIQLQQEFILDDTSKWTIKTEGTI